MPTYKVTNRANREAGLLEAPYAQVACERLGWLIGECHVELVREGPYSDLAKRPVVIRPTQPRKAGDNGG